MQVLLLVWDDTTNNLGLHSGLMGTHDQETLNFFKDTGVTCVLCPRQGGEEDTMLQVWPSEQHKQPQRAARQYCSHSYSSCRNSWVGRGQACTCWWFGQLQPQSFNLQPCCR